MSTAAANRWGSTGSRTGSGEAGILYLALLFSIILIGIATAVAAPLWRTLVQREKEAELLFRLSEFERAITAYQVVHKRFPQKLEDLLEDKTQLQTRRYLRRIYPDPMTGKADWALEYQVDTAGVPSGIKDVHSRSTDVGFKRLRGKGERYRDW
jgi:type II secretory pathway pseudopilin PulG